jgi:hypothetical protein
MPILVVQGFRKNMLSTEPAMIEYGGDGLVQHPVVVAAALKPTSRRPQPLVIN